MVAIGKNDLVADCSVYLMYLACVSRSYEGNAISSKKW